MDPKHAHTAAGAYSSNFAADILTLQPGSAAIVYTWRTPGSTTATAGGSTGGYSSGNGSSSGGASSDASEAKRCLLVRACRPNESTCSSSGELDSVYIH